MIIQWKVESGELKVKMHLQHLPLSTLHFQLSTFH